MKLYHFILNMFKRTKNHIDLSHLDVKDIAEITHKLNRLKQLKAEVNVLENEIKHILNKNKLD